ncbi:MAG: ABC transporter permease [Spirochaetaceae bacterium]|nr:ABC transporter permease [Spirochaetaceae bacterium]
MIKILTTLLSTMRVQMKQSFARPMFRFCLIANPILSTVLLYQMYRNAGEENFFAFVVLGAGLMGLWSCICFSSAGDINRERYSGTLALIFVAPVSFPIIILGKIIGNTVMSLLTLVISLVTAVVIFRIPVKLESPMYFFLSLMVTILAFVVISSVIAYMLTLSRKTELYMNLIEIPLSLLCGFVFPVTILPQGVRFVSYILSPTHAVELLRMSVWGVHDTEMYFQKLAIVLGLTALYTVLSILLYRKIETRVRIQASLEVA